MKDWRGSNGVSEPEMNLSQDNQNNRYDPRSESRAGTVENA